MIKVYVSSPEDYLQKNSHKYKEEHKRGQLLLCRGLSREFGIELSPHTLPDELGQVGRGKPVLKSYPHIHFNISHCTGGMAACAFSQAPVGMDIEKIRPFRDLLISRILTPQEQEFLEAKSKTQNSRQEWFFRFWTLKESYIKYTGQGLSMPLNSFSFSFTQTEEGIKITSSLPGLTFRQILLRENHLLSVCSPLSEPIELVYPD